jgi:hypothetical protein
VCLDKYLRRGTPGNLCFFPYLAHNEVFVAISKFLYFLTALKHGGPCRFGFCTFVYVSFWIKVFTLSDFISNTDSLIKKDHNKILFYNHIDKIERFGIPSFRLCRSTVSFICCKKEFTLVQLLWKITWQYLLEFSLVYPAGRGLRY